MIFIKKQFQDIREGVPLTAASASEISRQYFTPKLAPPADLFSPYSSSGHCNGLCYVAGGGGTAPNLHATLPRGVTPRTLLASRLGTPPDPSVRCLARGGLLRLTRTWAKGKGHRRPSFRNGHLRNTRNPFILIGSIMTSVSKDVES